MKDKTKKPKTLNLLQKRTLEVIDRSRTIQAEHLKQCKTEAERQTERLKYRKAVLFMKQRAGL